MATNQMHWMPQGGVFCVITYCNIYGFGGHFRSDPKFSIAKSIGKIFEFQKNFFTIGFARVQTLKFFWVTKISVTWLLGLLFLLRPLSFSHYYFNQHTKLLLETVYSTVALQTDEKYFEYESVFSFQFQTMVYVQIFEKASWIRVRILGYRRK